ncbi:MAG: hypothetical protein C5B50_25230 [Verrucomicrobia bacterium]|nr:MAG: hypothetical protein C5B50_25230 [Verrucomicrobiota bacterium]
MKTVRKRAKPHRNGRLHSREELLAALDQALEKGRKQSREEAFQSLLRAGILTAKGKLAPRYGGSG